MKIVAQKVFVANVSRTNFVFVKLYTDEGIEGVGEATLEWKTQTVVSALEELERVLIGCDPFQVDAIVHRLHRDSYWRTGAVFRTVGPVMNAMTLHVAVAIPNFSIFETVSMDVPWRKELVRETIRFEDGHILAPTAPGLGVELVEEACARFPYEPSDVPLFDGTINTRGVATGAEALPREDDRGAVD